MEAAPSLEITTSRQFLLGLKDSGELSIFERTFNRCMGMCTTLNGFWMTSLYQSWRFENLFVNGEVQDGYDRLYLPQVGYTTGDLDVHDMAVDGDGRLVFVNTLFGCLATISDTHSFVPLWRPRFLSRLAAEDRCHRNGLAMKDGAPGFVTAMAVSDVVDGWREHRRDGGVVIDVPSGEIVARGLSMPRNNRTFEGLPLDEALTARNAVPRCGVMVIDLRTADVAHWLRIEGIVNELYDVITLPGVVRPMALGFRTDEIRRVVSVGDGP